MGTLAGLRRPSETEVKPRKGRNLWSYSGIDSRETTVTLSHSSRSNSSMFSCRGVQTSYDEGSEILREEKHVWGVGVAGMQPTRALRAVSSRPRLACNVWPDGAGTETTVRVRQPCQLSCTIMVLRRYGCGNVGKPAVRPSRADRPRLCRRYCDLGLGMTAKNAARETQHKSMAEASHGGIVRCGRRLLRL